MKKTLFVALLVSLITIPAMMQAQTKQTAKQTTGKQLNQSEQTTTTGNGFQGRNYTDKNGDGVCDHFISRRQGANGPNFVDKDGNGVCDNRGTNMRQGRGNGFGKAGCKGHRHGHGRGYNGQCRQGQSGNQSVPASDVSSKTSPEKN